MSGRFQKSSDPPTTPETLADRKKKKKRGGGFGGSYNLLNMGLTINPRLNAAVISPSVDYAPIAGVQPFDTVILINTGDFSFNAGTYTLSVLHAGTYLIGHTLEITTTLGTEYIQLELNTLIDFIDYTGISSAGGTLGRPASKMINVTGGTEFLNLDITNISAGITAIKNTSTFWAVKLA